MSNASGKAVSKENHEKFIRRAIELSGKAALEYSTGGVFGAVVVKDGKIVSEGMNRVVASHDPTWHAEMEAIRLACITLQSFKLNGCTLYTAGEPCPMCLATSYWAGIGSIYYAATVADALKYGNFDDSFIYKELALPVEKRSIKMTEMLREEAVEVWKKYQQKPDKVPY
ncbi:MAG: nucleoside deaminase [Candidatus Koribacter versatilis]|uniref:Nucleoside deaminase n=1 Tax=Candidatus Korobacter versatilis TaxID=658062 RepID=A0A932A7Y5_9BACT|nr:nucleoside deaminase [Candidatus Koribacter versatilis]